MIALETARNVNSQFERLARRLEPWNGDIFAVRLVPSGGFAAGAKNMGDEPNVLA